MKLSAEKVRRLFRDNVYPGTSVDNLGNKKSSEDHDQDEYSGEGSTDYREAFEYFEGSGISSEDAVVLAVPVSLLNSNLIVDDLNNEDRSRQV